MFCTCVFVSECVCLYMCVWVYVGVCVCPINSLKMETVDGVWIECHSEMTASSSKEPSVVMNSVFGQYLGSTTEVPPKTKSLLLIFTN